MAWDTLWKPYSQGGLNPGGVSFLLPRGGSYRNVDILDSSGNVVDSLRRSTFGEEHGVKFYSPKPGSAYGNDLRIRVGLGDGSEKYFNIPYGGGRYEGTFSGDENLMASSGGSGGGGGGPAVAPFNLIGFFPEPETIRYKRTRPAKYNITDPMAFAQEYGQFNRDEILRNYDIAKQLGLSQLDQELAGLQKYVPASAALKREQTSIDNIFNQEQRTRQIRTALPGVTQQLEGQAGRAEAYASGRLPSAVDDAALSLGTRSRAADAATAGGFGATSSVARKASDLMSAEQRIQLSQYGDQLLSANINQKAGLLLAPTSYSTAGQEVRVMPEVGAGRLTAQALSELNAATVIPPATALSTKVQQKQFKTSLVQRTKEFNTSNQLQTDVFNANAKNQFAMSQFGYQVAQAGIEAGVQTANNNTALELSQQAKYADIFSSFMQNAQNATQAGAVASGIGEIITAGSQLIDSLSSNQAAEQPAQPDSGGRLTPSDGGQSTQDFSPSSNTNGIPGGVVVPSGEPVPSGYTGMQSNPDGSVTAVPNQSSSAEVIPFMQDTGLDLQSSVSPSTRDLVRGSDVVLRSAGISSMPTNGSQSAGVTRAGTPVYSNRAMLQSSDGTMGGSYIDTLKQVLDPTGAFSEEDRSTLDQVAAVARDAGLLTTLAEQHKAGDTKGFINTILGAVKQPSINALSKDPQNRAGMQAAYTAYNLYNNWTRMSPAQKSLAMVSTALQGVQFADGTNLATKPIIKPTLAADGKTVVRPGLNVGDALSLFQSGYNVYSMVDNWDQLSDFQKVTYGVSNITQMAELGQRFNMLGTGVNGAEVFTSAAQLTEAGFTSAPALGVGAATGPTGAAIPEGYSLVSTVGGESVIAPTGTAASAEGATASTAGSYVGTAAGVVGIAAGAYTVYQGWGSGGTKGAVNGLIGGASMAAGLSTLGATNPYLLAAVVAVSVISNAVKVGKHEDQIKRDAVRFDLKSRGMLDDAYNITLADGSKYDLGIDGKGGLHNITDASRLSTEHKQNGFGRDNQLHSYDVDYTNDLDYAAQMGTTTLTRLLYGGVHDNTDKLGGQMANAALSSVGYNQQMTEENFGKTMQNVRSFYAQSGISSKADGYQLANMAYAEGRINDTELVTMHQSLDMLFDENGYDHAKVLMGGRDRGTDVAVENATAGTERRPPKEPKTTQPINPIPGFTALKPGSIDPGRYPTSNINGVPNSTNPVFGQMPTLINLPNTLRGDQNLTQPLGVTYWNKNNAFLSDKSSVQALNRSRYATQSAGAQLA